MQHSMIWIGLGEMSTGKGAGDVDGINRLGAYSGAMAQSPKGEPQPVKSDLETASRLGKRVAMAAVRWAKGR